MARAIQRSAAAALLLVVGCATPSGREGTAAPPPRAPEASPASAAAADEPRAVLLRFLQSLKAGRFAQAHSLLSARWRARYTPERLAADYAGAGPVGAEAVERAAAALGSSVALEVREGRALLPLSSGTALLVEEKGSWKVDALE